MLKKVVFLIFIFLSGMIYSQKKYPKDFFQNPMDIPLILSGTFGELRSNHFHAGIDIKTQQQEGLNVFASGSGYISRIKISHWGYGKALYVTHPNGYTTVYGHLKKFSPKIEAYVKKRQYEKESFQIQLYPKPSELKVSKGEVIALSGNSGSSGGPHLHFEIRDTKAKPINPMLFGIKIPDHKKPIFKNAVAYAKNDTSQVNQSNNYIDLVIKQQNNGDFLANKIYAYGTIGIGVNATDRLDGAINNNGLYDLQLEVNGEKRYQYTVETFSFSESRYLNNFIDYKRFIKKKQRVQKCFIDPNTKLSIYRHIIDKGLLFIRDSLEYRIQITASDFKGNQTKLIIPIQGKKDTIIHYKKIKKTPYYFKADQTNKISDSTVIASFPKNIFYNDFYFDYQYKNGVYYGGKEIEPSIKGISPIIKNIAQDYDLVFNIDLHTGYGKRGTLHLFPNPIEDNIKKEKIENIFSGIHIDWGGEGDFYTVTGDFCTYIGQIIQGKYYLTMTFEFGTLDTQVTNGAITAIHNIILENQGIHYGYKSREDEKAVKKRFLEGYYPSRKPWRSKAIIDAKNTLLKAVKNYQLTDI